MSEGKMFKTAIHYGSLSGIAVIVFYMALYYGGFNVFGQMSLLGVWIPVVFLVMATKFHRSNNLGGFMTYRQGLSVGFATTIFSITLFGLFFYLFGTVIDANLLDSYKSQAAESLEQGKEILSERMMDKAYESIETMTISSLAFSEAFNKMIGGVISTLIIAAIYLRKQQPIHEA
ncbi:MAG: DUF4199 domain-containing protein [Bacteroidota bacterium]|nr:DUF4199 domain-containing protein [Bacteroidota bacterium]